MELIESKYQSKNWRINQNWYINGKKNECELYQLSCIEHIMNIKLVKTNLRFNIMTNTRNILGW
jgi:hypothetical protein